METQVLNNNGGTEILNNSNAGGTQVISGSSNITNGESAFTGGFLNVGEEVAGCIVQSKINTSSGEADLYIAKKGEETVVLKYYRNKLKAKESVLEKIKNINNPNVITLIDYGYDNNHFYEVMQYAEGGSINDKNDDKSYKYLPFDEETAIQLCRQIINAFKACHENGVIHRDIKPDNIYFKDVEKKEFVIGDFGISSVMEEDELIHITRSASRTTGYAAPEVLSGNITPALDYYSLGIVLWEVMNAQNPFLLENGEPRNPAHLLRDTIEGRIADDLLSRKPFLSEKMQHLIRGLLVIDSSQRWGYKEVSRFLDGENVDVYVPKKKNIELRLGGKTFTSLEDLGTEIMTNTDSAIADFQRGYIKKDVEKYDEELANKIGSIQEKASANKIDVHDTLMNIAFLLNPKLPVSFDNGYTANSLEEIQNIVENAPESISQYLFNTNSRLYFYLDSIQCGSYSESLEKQFGSLDIARLSPVQIAENMAKAAVILRDYKIKPFPMEKYKDVELSSVEQLETLPKSLQDYVLSVVRTKCYDGLLLSWLELLALRNFESASTWDELVSLVCN